MYQIPWEKIVSECDGYKAGFVAIFRKYEGASTDERDGRGAIVKVSQNSFADHVGIPRETFRRWVRNFDDPNRLGSDQKAARTAASHANVAKNMARSKPSDLVDAIMAAGTGATDQVFHELNLRRQGYDTSEANRKRAEAQTHEMMKPFREFQGRNSLELCIAHLQDATEQLRDANAAEIVDGKAVRRIEAELENFQLALAEARFRIS